ncbi:MAG: helix-turn-helix domain-containing protein [Treponema sp.]|jgi:excisionase family DNA binding protein|nr:helix-turn-helix domain-containing protein [Treponema sp.]
MENLLTVQDAADLLQLSTSTVYKYAENGILPSFCIGTNRRLTPKVYLSNISTVSKLPSIHGYIPLSIMKKEILTLKKNYVFRIVINTGYTGILIFKLKEYVRVIYMAV